jgi:hypothetical protein
LIPSHDVTYRTGTPVASTKRPPRYRMPEGWCTAMALTVLDTPLSTSSILLLRAMVIRYTSSPLAEVNVPPRYRAGVRPGEVQVVQQVREFWQRRTHSGGCAW